MPASRSTKNGADLIAEWIGETPVAGVGGANIEDLFFALWKRNPGTQNVILSRHESSACAFADGYARSSNRPGIVLATSGGGALNLIPGIGEAFASRVPLLALIGQAALSTEGTGAFQETTGRAGTFSIETVFQACTKKVFKVTQTNQLSEILNTARSIATEHPQGPVALFIPKNIFSEQIAEQRVEAEISPSTLKIKPDELHVQSDLHQNLNFFERLTKPFFIFGANSVRTVSPSLIREAMSLAGVPWAATLEAKSAGDFSDTGFTGLVGVIGHPEVADALSEANEIVIVGSRLGAIDRFGIEKYLVPGKCFYVNTEAAFEPSRWFLKDDHFVVSTLESFMHSFSAFKKNQNLGWNPLPLSKNATPLFDDSDLLSLRGIGAELSPLVGSRPTNLILDAGNAVSSFALHSPRPIENAKCLIAMGMGGMGYSFGASLGAYFANQLPTVIFSGDGAFLMNGSEFQIAVERRYPILLILADNGGHAMCSTRDQLFFNSDTKFNRFSHTDYAKGLAGLYPDISVLEAKDFRELRASVEKLKNFVSPSILVLKLPHDELPEFQPFQAALKTKEFHYEKIPG